MDKIDVFCGINSIGMPNTTDNKDNYGYLDYVKNYLIQKGYEVNAYNFSSLDHNYTWDFEKVFKNNYSMDKIRNIQIASIDNLRKVNPLFKLVVPKKYQEKLKQMENNEKIADVYKDSSKPIFLYSGGLNDILIYMRGGPVELLNKNIRDNMANNFYSFFDKAINNVRNNFILLKELNPNVDIYALTVSDSNIFKLIDKIINLQEINTKNNILPKNILNYLLTEFNKKLIDLSSEFDNVHIIDLYSEMIPCANLDFHPSREGNIIIGEKIVKQLEINYFNNKEKHK